MGFLGWIILGLLADIVAKAILPGRAPRLGLIMTTLLGVAGTLLGGAIVGAVLILLVFGAVAGRGTRRRLGRR